ncbi:hypothetical protein GBAR_LOCUS29287 [Geodia barretti]|uniref:Uncharacterized protein n=1 Tax=Geodia barretti TaxID=519541 RepID=A0AA35TUZ0_GEOBA|nr:hypothetical protein GBAR_LOCUS29287 [Geodia barretti]
MSGGCRATQSWRFGSHGNSRSLDGVFYWSLTKRFPHRQSLSPRVVAPLITPSPSSPPPSLPPSPPPPPHTVPPLQPCSRLPWTGRSAREQP